MQIGTLPPVVSHQLALLAELLLPPPDDRPAVMLPAAGPLARRQTPLQVIGGGVRLPDGAFITTP